MSEPSATTPTSTKAAPPHAVGAITEPSPSGAEPSGAGAGTGASRRAEVLRNVVRNPTGKVAIGLLVVLGLAAVLAPLIATHDPLSQSLLQTNEPPSWLGGGGDHLLGTDDLGRDVFSRMVHGARLSLLFGLVTSSCTAVLGLFLGLVAGWYERVAGPILMRLADIQFAVPFVAVGIVVAAIFGPGVTKLVVILSLWGWTIHARTIVNTVSQVRRMDFITSVQIYGASTPRILFRHVLPNVLGPVIILWSTSAGVLVLAESALSLLGIGVVAPDFSLGSMLAGSQTALRLAWWSVVFPGLTIMLLVIGFNLLGDALRDALNPAVGRAAHDPDLI